MEVINVDTCIQELFIGLLFNCNTKLTRKLTSKLQQVLHYNINKLTAYLVLASNRTRIKEKEKLTVDDLVVPSATFVTCSDY